MTVPKELKSPITIIALLMLFGVLILIGAAIAGLDHGVLENMGESAYARGLITYLFAVVTVGTAVVLIVSVLTSDAGKENDDRFNKGKEILSLLLGIFGTIVGFYFGAETGREKTLAPKLHVAAPLLSPSTVNSGENVVITSLVYGGQSPYKYGATMGNQNLDTTELLLSTGENSWAKIDSTAPQVETEQLAAVTFYAEDATGESAQATSYLRIVPRP